MQASLSIDATIEAPARKGTQFGSILITLDNNPVAKASLVALQSVAESGLVGRMMDQVLLMFGSLFD